MRTVLIAALFPFICFAQSEEPRVIVVPVPTDAVDAGVSGGARAAPTPEMTSPPTQQPVPQPTAPADAMPQPPPVLPENLQPSPDLQNPAVDMPPPPPSAMIDGHPREGSFLSGPGSMAFVVHHTLLGGLGLLATQMVPRTMCSAAAGSGNAADVAAFGCGAGVSVTSWSDEGSRLAYLAGTLLGAGIGFGAAAFYQFNTWVSPATAMFTSINSLIGAFFGIGIANMATPNPTAISWVGLLAAETAAWLTTLLGSGDFPFAKGLLITTGAAWSAIFTSLILAVVATTGGGNDLRRGIDTLMVMPALGATALALASLKFNPSVNQIMRANVFGGGVAAGVLLLSVLVLGGRFDSPVPYILAGVSGAAAITVVSLLWVDTVDAAPTASLFDPEKSKGSRRVWW